jgi:hypothetical protein
MSTAVKTPKSTVSEPTVETVSIKGKEYEIKLFGHWPNKATPVSADVELPKRVQMRTKQIEKAAAKAKSSK